MHERHLRWWTPHLSRDFDLLVFGEGQGLPLILFPTSFGNFRQCKDFHLTDACAELVESGKVTIYCPDAIDLESFYNKAIHPADRMRTHNAYERTIVHDVFEQARRDCGAHRVAVCGASLGAYHAANIAFRYPDLVSHLISLSGAFEIGDFFDGYYDDNIYFNSPFHYLPHLPETWRFNHMTILLGTGEWDNTRPESLRLAEMLRALGIPHQLDDRRWSGHDWNYWRDMLPHYLSLC